MPLFKQLETHHFWGASIKSSFFLTDVNDPRLLLERLTRPGADLQAVDAVQCVVGVGVGCCCNSRLHDVVQAEILASFRNAIPQSQLPNMS